MKSDPVATVIDTHSTKPLPFDESWQSSLGPELEKPYMKSLKQFLLDERARGKKIFPRASQFFTALQHTSLDQVKVVIVGQDPYHGLNQAHGLSFSVPEGVPHPPSLQNIFKELNADLQIPIPISGSLVSWANQGVLLLNSVLSVEEGRPASHQGKGWELFTDAVIRCIDKDLTNKVFLLWGSYAQKKASFVDRKKHFVLTAVHPSPLSAYRGFFGSRPFSKINEYLVKTNQSPIDWRLDSKTEAVLI